VQTATLRSNRIEGDLKTGVWRQIGAEIIHFKGVEHELDIWSAQTRTRVGEASRWRGSGFGRDGLHESRWSGYDCSGSSNA
jgi:hypothetical protein